MALQHLWFPRTASGWLNHAMAAPLFVDPSLLGAFPSSARADAEMTMGAFSQPLHPTPSRLIQDTNQQAEGFYPAIYVHGEPLHSSISALLRVAKRGTHERPHRHATAYLCLLDVHEATTAGSDNGLCLLFFRQKWPGLFPSSSNSAASMSLKSGSTS